METHYVEVEGARLAYELVGNGPALVFVHAGIADRRMWAPQVQTFASRYRVLTYDQRGYGESSMPPGRFMLARDLIGLMRAVGVGPAVVIGCSMGGTTALDATIAEPPLVRALVSVGGGMSGNRITPSPEMQAAWAEAERLQHAGDTDGANEVELRMWVDGPGRTPEQVNPQVRELARQMNLLALQREPETAHGTPEWLDPPAAGRLDEVRVPMLAIVGAEDQPTILRTADELVAGIAGARKVVIQGAAHLPSLEKPAEFNQALAEFLIGLPA